MKLFGVIGRPILHSRSPELHNAAFAALGIEARYIRLASQDAAGTLETARKLGIDGLNATAPYKEAVAQLASERDAATEVIGAANTLLWRGEAWLARNTDIAGVQGALARHKVELCGALALVLGAGGAARAAAVALRGSGANVVVAARNPDRARSVASLVGGTACSFQDANTLAGGARVIVSAVCTDERLLEPDCFRPGTAVLDARYQSESALIRDAKRRGCEIVDGREWLLCQAAEAFHLFTGREAPLDAMDKGLKEERPRRGGMLSITGFMGVGKTSVARLLGERLGLPVLGTDELVGLRAGMSVDRLLRERGEPALRDWEQKVLEALPDSPGVLSCGGGLNTHAHTTNMLRGKSRLVVWLWAGPETCLERIGDTSSRPLLQPCPETSAPRLLQQRMGCYAGACDVVVDTEGKSAGDVATVVSDLWRECT